MYSPPSHSRTNRIDPPITCAAHNGGVPYNMNVIITTCAGDVITDTTVHHPKFQQHKKIRRKKQNKPGRRGRDNQHINTNLEQNYQIEKRYEVYH